MNRFILGRMYQQYTYVLHSVLKQWDYCAPETFITALPAMGTAPLSEIGRAHV